MISEKKIVVSKDKNRSFLLTNLSKLFLNKQIIKAIHGFLGPDNCVALKSFAQKNFSIKEKKRQLKERLGEYVVDFGKYNELVKYRFLESNKLIVSTSVFNLQKNVVRKMTLLDYNKELIEMEKTDFYKFLKMYPKHYFNLSNGRESFKLCKALVPFDVVEDDTIEEEDEGKKYQLYYEEAMHQLGDLSTSDFSKESLIERQKKILEIMNSKKEEIFYPLCFVSSISFWAIILCQGGYFACGFFNKDKLLEHKSDHKYVTRKKAGQRQIVKDKSKSTKNSVGAQLRREGEKKHQENIECILKVNEELLSKCEVIYLFAPGLNKNILIGSNEKALFTFKNKILNIPFSISRANYSHMIEVYNKLTTITFELDLIK